MIKFTFLKEESSNKTHKLHNVLFYYFYKVFVTFYIKRVNMSCEHEFHAVFNEKNHVCILCGLISTIPQYSVEDARFEICIRGTFTKNQERKNRQIGISKVPKHALSLIPSTQFVAMKIISKPQVLPVLPTRYYLRKLS